MAALMVIVAARTAPPLEAQAPPRPGSDFFAYANGAWLAATSIPEGRDRWTGRNDIDTLTRRQLASLLDEAERAPAGSLARKVGDFRRAWLDTAAIEARGLAPLCPLLDSVDQIADRAGLSRFLGADLGADVDPLYLGVFRSARLFGLAVEPGVRGEGANVAILVQGGLGLGAREPYLAGDSASAARRLRYLEYAADLLGRCGAHGHAEHAASVLALETALATGQATDAASASDTNGTVRWNRTDFPREAPGIDWEAFFRGAGLTNPPAFIVWQPGAVRTAAALVESTPLETWKDYLRFHLLDRYAEVLPRDIAGRALAVRDDARPRMVRASAATQSYLGPAVGRLYAERYFPPAAKARVTAIVGNVLAAFRRHVDHAAWLSPASRAIAQAKLARLYFGVGYPERWEDDGDLAIDPADPVGNLRRVAAHDLRATIARLEEPVDPRRWWLSPATVGAVLVFERNEYNFPAALLQAPKFYPGGSDAENYGSIGAIVGHEISHFVDRLGSEYDVDGRKRRWWTAEDSARFEAAIAPLVRQVSSYRPFPDLGVDGALTQTENIADLGGLVAAFEAWRLTLGPRARDRAWLRAQDRAFFIAFARSWRTMIRPEAMRTQLRGNDHAPEMFRVATVRNLDAWYDAFDVRPGDSLYVAPEDRVRIW
ncbi:MAG TPA: M13 family metallopeptidase [Gemmatimonadales bacterium]|nr:M13 family metallopeptidase [Gemmatimonadales bacterium]